MSQYRHFIIMPFLSLMGIYTFFWYYTSSFSVKSMSLGRWQENHSLVHGRHAVFCYLWVCHDMSSFRPIAYCKFFLLCFSFCCSTVLATKLLWLRHHAYCKFLLLYISFCLLASKQAITAHARHDAAPTLLYVHYLHAHLVICN